MNLISQAFTFPAIILPAFIGVAFFMAILLRQQNIVVTACLALAIGCAGMAVSAVLRNTPLPVEAPVPSIEADMLVSRGNNVDLYLNDWQHPPESVPVVAGERHVYRFIKVPANITLLRLDPSDAPAARIVIYSLTVKAGNQVVRQFGPAELKSWTVANLSAPQEEKGGLAMLGTSDDPILWTNSLAVHLPEVGPPHSPSLVQLYYRPAGLALAALLLLALARMATGTSRLAAWLNYPWPELPAWGMALVVLLVAGCTLYLQNQATNSDIGIEVDMFVSRGVGVDLFLNDWQHPPERLPVIAGERHVYHFQKVPNRITLLRLDPTDLPDARIVIYSVVARSRSQIFQQLGPAELKRWTLMNLSAPQEENGGLVLTDTNDDPVLWSRLAWQLPGGHWQALAPLFDPNDGLFLFTMGVFLLLLLARMSSGTGRMQAVLVAVASCVAFPIVSFILKLNLLPPPGVTSSVGYASYTGYGKANEHFSATVVLLVSILLGCAFARFAGRGEDALEETVAASRRRNVWIVHAAVFGLLLLYFLPNLRLALQSMGGVSYQHFGWDDANFFYWGYLINKGLRPLRDFWFPYSGSYLQYLPFPAGTIFSILHAAVVLWVCYVALLKATGRRLTDAVVVFGLILAPVLLAMLPGWNRYLLGVDVALLYVSIYDARRWEWKIHVPIAVFVGYAFFFEPTQVIYASAGIVAHTALTLIAQFQGRSLRQGMAEGLQILRQRFLYAGVPLLAGITGAVLVYAANGMLPGLWDFEKSLGDQGDYGAWPSEISQWVMPVLQPDTVFLLMFLLLSYAVYRWIRLNGRQDDRLGTALVVLCATAFLGMQKQIVRPHGMSQLRVFPYVAVLIFGLIVWRERKPFTRMVIAVFLGCFLGVVVHRNVFQGIFQRDIEEGPAKISGSADALLHHQKDFDQLNATLYSRSRFPSFAAENAVVDNLVQVCGLRPQDAVYVLGDASIFYLLLDLPGPYLTNSYNDSPIYEQQKVLNWFQRKRPRFVVWGTNELEYDRVPHAVRLPLIYTYVVEHYQFVRSIGQYHILAERPPNQPSDLAYWRRVLGERVDLGHVPARARESEYAACGGDVARCDAVLVVKYPKPRPVPHNKLTVDIDSPSGPFRVQFDVAPHEREYVVNLNRLWFWNSLPKSTPPRITAEDGAAETVTNYRRERHPVLY